MAKKKKQSFTIMILCVVLLILCGGYFLADKYQKTKNTDDNVEDEMVLYSIDKEKLVKFHYKNTKADLTFIKEGETWKVEGDKAFPIEQSIIESMIDNSVSVSAKRIVTKDCADLSKYELDEPALQIELTDEEGNYQKIAYGMESAVAEGCYAYANDTKKIYIVSSEIATEFEYSKNELMVLPKLDNISAEYITSYSVEAKEGAGFKAVYDKKNAKYKDIYGWDITKPYSQTVAGDLDGLQTAFSGATAIEFAEGISYEASKKELKQYGLLYPSYTLSLEYYTIASENDTKENSDTEEEKEYHKLKLLIGEMDDLEENYYVTLEGDSGIYLLSVETVESLVEIDAFSCAYTTPCPISIETLEKVSLNYVGKVYDMTLEKSKKADSDKTSEDETETAEYKYTAKVNNKEVDEEAFRSACEAFAEIQFTSEIKSNVKPKEDTPVATIRFTQEDKKFMVSFLPYDGVNFYRVDVDGVCQFVADKNLVDKTLKNLAAIK